MRAPFLALWGRRGKCVIDAKEPRPHRGRHKSERHGLRPTTQKGRAWAYKGGVQKGANTVGTETYRPLLPMDQPGGTLPAMNIRRKRIELNEKLRRALKE